MGKTVTNPDLQKAKREVDAVTRPKTTVRAALKAGLKKITDNAKADVRRRRDAAVDAAQQDMEVLIHFDQNVDAFIDGVLAGTGVE